MKKRWVLFGVVIIICLSVAAFFARFQGFWGQGGPGQEELHSIKMAGSLEASGWHEYEVSMREIITAAFPEGYTVEITGTSGAIDNLKSIDAGQAEVGLAVNVMAGWAADGAAAFDRKLENVRGLIGGLSRCYVVVMANGRLGVRSLDEVFDKKLPINLFVAPEGSGGEYITRLVLEEYGVSYEHIKSWGGSVQQTSMEVICEAMIDGRADVFIHMIGTGHPSVNKITLNSDITILPLQEDVIQRLVDAYGFEAAALPAGSFRGQEEKIGTVGAETALVANKDLPDDIAYIITKTVCDNKDKLAEMHQALRDFNPQAAWEPTKIGAPLLGGAQKYYGEMGWMK